MTETGTPKNMEPLQKILGGPAIRHCYVLNDRRYVLTKDTEENVALYDVLKACKVEEIGQVDFDLEVKKRNKTVYVPNWFNVDLKTGVSCKIFELFYCIYFFFLGYVLFLDVNNSFRSRRKWLLISMGFR